MSKKNKKQAEMEFTYEMPEDFEDQEEQVIYIDENGNTIDEQGNPINYVDEDGNSIQLDLPASEEVSADEEVKSADDIVIEETPILEHEEVQMEAIDQANDEYKEDEIFEPYTDEELIEHPEVIIEEITPVVEPEIQQQPVFEETVQNDNQQNYQESTPTNYQMNSQQYEPVAFQPTNKTIIRQIAPGIEEVTYVEYERVLPEEVMQVNRILDNNHVTPINFIERKRARYSNTKEDRIYVEYELDHPYGKLVCKPVSKIDDSEQRKEELFGNQKVFLSDFGSESIDDDKPFVQSRKEFNDGMRDIYNARKQRELAFAKQREAIYLQARQGSSYRQVCQCGCQYCCYNPIHSKENKQNND